MVTSSPATGSEVTPPTSQIAKVALVSWFGSLIEAYDWLICITLSAIAWPAVYFPNASPENAFLFSMAVFLTGFLVRPLGGCMLAHFGDRYGRRVPLLGSLMFMGLGSLAIGLVPPYNATGIFPGIGIWGGILVTACRVSQGIGYGGELSSAATWIAEYANLSKRRSVWTGLIQQAIAGGTLLSSFTITLLLAVFSRPVFLDWGWRLPFFAGATVALIGIIIRFRMTEAPIFRSFLEKRKVARTPSLSVLKEMPWTVIKLSGALIWFSTANYMTTGFGMVYMQQVSKVSSALAVSTGIVVAIAMSSCTFIGSFVGNTRIGRRGALLISQGSMVAMGFPYFIMLGSSNPILLYLAQFLLAGLAYLGTGCIYAMETELWPTKFRVSAASWTHNLGVMGSGFAPFIAAAIIAAGGGMGAWPYVAIMIMAYGGIAAMCTLLLPEPSKGPLRED